MSWKHWFRWKVIYRITQPFRTIGKFLARIFNIYRVTIILVIIGLYLLFRFDVSSEELIPNIVTDLFSVALTVFIIDTMYRLRSDNERKKVLVSKLGSKNNAVASEALRELDARGWLSDGTLEGAFLLSANLDGNSLTGANLKRVTLSYASMRDTSFFETDLRGAFLDNANFEGASFSQHAIGPHYAEADLTGAGMSHSNLKDAKIRNEQLVKTRSLWKTIMPDGSLYDGRYNLKDDINLHLKFAKDPKDPSEWAKFYGVSVEQYLRGQTWAKDNLNPDTYGYST